MIIALREKRQHLVLKLMIEYPVSLRGNPDPDPIGTSYSEQIVSGAQTAALEIEPVSWLTNVNQKVGWKVKACLTLKPVYKVKVISFPYVKKERQK